MPTRSGRLEKRTRLTVPVEISNPQDAAGAERTTTENASALGIRVLAQHARAPNERLMIKSLEGELPALVRVVYCQRLPDGRFAVGLQFQGQAVNWLKGLLGSAAG